MIPPSTAKTRTFRVGEKYITVFEPSKMPYMMADAGIIFCHRSIIRITGASAGKVQIGRPH